MSKEQTKPSESLVQDLLAERRELKVAVERLKLELADAGANAGGPDPRLRERQEEIERLRYQLASARAEVTRLQEERDELRAGIQRASARSVSSRAVNSTETTGKARPPGRRPTTRTPCRRALR